MKETAGRAYVFTVCLLDMIGITPTKQGQKRHDTQTRGRVISHIPPHHRKKKRPEPGAGLNLDLDLDLEPNGGGGQRAKSKITLQV